MSSIWTPGGEHRVPRGDGAAAAPGDEPAVELTDEERADEAALDEFRREMAALPAAVVVTNHCLGLWELAVLHLQQDPPKLDEAKVAIDALGAVVERLDGRLGDEEPALKDALAQVQLWFVKAKS